MRWIIPDGSETEIGSALILFNRKQENIKLSKGEFLLWHYSVQLEITTQS